MHKNKTTKSILITGTSSGIGNATVNHFAKNNLKVFATMRNIKGLINEHPENIIPVTLDGSDNQSIGNGIALVLSMTQNIDVW